MDAVHFSSVILICKVDEAGGVFVSAPVLGTVPVAEQGKLSILVSADSKDVFSTLEAMLTTLGRPMYELYAVLVCGISPDFFSSSSLYCSMGEKR